MIAQERKFILVTRCTPLENLITKYNTLEQARFYIEHLGADFSDYVEEYQQYIKARKIITTALEQWGRFQIIDRRFLPNFVFAQDDIVIVLGQDGLVANTLKYLNNQPLIAINPDPKRYDGILLPFKATDIQKLLHDVANERRPIKKVSMAKAELKDGQVLYAVNDLFIGQKTHISARYKIKLNDYEENQSSSGIIISTGLGSTGWMKSIITGAQAINKSFNKADGQKYDCLSDTKNHQAIDWSADILQFAVREPFPSRLNKTDLVAGMINKNQKLEIISAMSETGVIFSDGIESDFILFNAGMSVQISVAERKGNLII